MKNFIFTTLILALILHVVHVSGQKETLANSAKHKPVTASSERADYPATAAVNGIISRNSKWMTDHAALPPHFLEIDLQSYFNITGMVVHTGIPEEERTPDERSQAAGFWAVKHFQLQYWDDANWTDIPNSEITENRETSAVFDFSPAILTHKVRFVAFDGEPLNVLEIEVFGEKVPGMVVPEFSISSGKTFFEEQLPEQTKDAVITVFPEVTGKTMKYVAYNQAYYLPGTNVSRWLEYSEVNSLRVWTTLSTYAPVSSVETDSAITSLAGFEARKSELRKDPEKNRFINWNELKRIYAEPDWTGTNSMVFDYVLEETGRLGIDVLLQINERRFSGAWHHKWQQWQRFYALAYYAAMKGNVSMFAMQNEPNHRHSGPMSIEEWLTGMQIVSDAVRCAVEDVNRRYNKQLTPRFVGPVTAGTNVDWWAEVIRNIRLDYRGEVVDYDLIDIFSTHSYNSPAAGYATRVENIRKIIRDNHPEGNEIPVVLTEIGRWMNAYLIDKEETMDSPSLFTEWAGIYTNNMLNGGYGMWAFKLANNVSSAYPRGIKSGHHFTWNGRRLVEDAWKNPASGKPVISSSGLKGSATEMVTDEDLSDHSSFVFDADPDEKWLEIDLLREETIGSAVVYTGSSYGIFTGPDRLRSFKLQFKNGDNWSDIPGASESDSKYVQVLFEFDEPVRARYFRLVAFDETEVKIREIKLFESGKGPENAPESYDISGIHRTGEVVRLFAKGFKEERSLLQTEVSVTHPALDACTAFDPESGNYYIWLVQRALFETRFTVDLSNLTIAAGRPVIAEAVGPGQFGEVVKITEPDSDSCFEIVLPGQTVMLITIPAIEKMQTVTASHRWAACVSGDNLPDENRETIRVSLDASNPYNNRVGYIHFNFLESIQTEKCRLAILGVNGFVDRGDNPMRIHVYGFPSEEINSGELIWETAPYLDENEAMILNTEKEVFLAGQLAFDREERFHYLDVTRHVRKHPGGVTFVFIRETRHMGDYEDKGRNVVISLSGQGKMPFLNGYFEH